MKNFFLLLLSVFVVNAAQAQNTPLFIYAKSDCSNRLEYHYNGQTNGSGIVSYSFSPSANQLYLFDVGAEGDRVYKALPKGTLSCNEANINDEIVRVINDGSRKAYILRAVNGGYLVSPVASATQVVRAGSTYIFRAHNFDFTVDTTNLDYGVNLASSNSSAYIFFNGRNYLDCHPVYTFKREPDQACVTKTDFDFIPGMGIFTERTGTTPEEAAENEYRLYSINGVDAMSYLNSVCQGKPIKPVESSVVSTTVVPTPTFVETPDKEVEVIKPVVHAAKPAFVGPKPLVDCPEKPGEGYHIVQPGETLNGIARAYRLKIGSLVVWNDINDPDLLVPCQKIYLSSPPGGLKTIDKNTGKLIVASKPTKKATKPTKTTKKKTAPRPVTHSTEEVIVKTQPKVKKQESQPQYAYWQQDATTGVIIDPATKIQYVPIYVQVPTGEERQTTVRPVAHNTEIEADYAMTTPKEVKETKKLASGTGIVHIVQPGESLYSIARLYGFTAERFRKMNGLPEDYILQPGMKLTTTDCSCEVPRQSTSIKSDASATYTTRNTTTQEPKGIVFEETDVIRPIESSTVSSVGGSGRFVEHTVRKGETLQTIASRYHVTVEDLVRTNSLEITETLIAGMRLMVPR